MTQRNRNIAKVYLGEKATCNHKVSLRASARFFRGLQKLANVNQTEMARKFSVFRKTYSNWCCGSAVPSWENIIGIANWLEESPYSSLNLAALFEPVACESWLSSAQEGNKLGYADEKVFSNWLRLFMTVQNQKDREFCSFAGWDRSASIIRFLLEGSTYPKLKNLEKLAFVLRSGEAERKLPTLDYNAWFRSNACETWHDKHKKLKITLCKREHASSKISPSDLEGSDQ